MTIEIEDDEEERWFRNYYECYRCGGTWYDEWSATCDDECPHCGAPDCSPVESEDLTDANNNEQPNAAPSVQ